MVSIECSISVPGFPGERIGDWTFVRAYTGKLQFDVTNDGLEALHGLNVRAVLESYVGQDKPQLYQWAKSQVIETIPPGNSIPVKFEFAPINPGVVSVALYVTDGAGKAVKAKRKDASTYGEGIVRYWFHVADDIQVEILQELRKLVARD